MHAEKVDKNITEMVQPDITEIESINESAIDPKAQQVSADADALAGGQRSADTAMRDFADRKQAINEAIANIPIEFEVNDKVLQIHSKSANRMVVIDKIISELQLLGEEEIEFPDFEEELSEEKLKEQRDEFMLKVEEKNAKIREKIFKVIFNIINPNLDKPEVTIEWLMEHLDITEGGVADQIIDAYNEKCNPGSLVKKILMSRKF